MQNISIYLKMEKLEAGVSVVVGTRDNIRGVVITSGSNIHTIVCLNVATAGIVTRDSTFGFLLKLPAGVLSGNTVDGIN